MSLRRSSAERPRLSRAVPAPLVVVLAAAVLAAPAGAATRSATACDPFAAKPCLMPFPNDMNLTVRDGATPTGLRVRLPAAAMPTNKDGKRITVGEYDRNDGFSPGQVIVARVPGLDTPAALRKTGAVGVADLGRSFDRAAPVLVINARTRRRQLIWAEIDANATSPSRASLLIHPGKNFDEGSRYIVVLRNLRTASGRRIAAPRSFRALLRGSGPRRYRSRYRSLLRTLSRAGVSRKGVYLTWDFTVASRRSLTDRLLAIRDDAFHQLGDTTLADRTVQGRPPAFAVTETQVFAPCGDDGCQDGESDRLARRVSGTFTVPCYLDRAGCPPGSRFHYSSKSKDAVPTQMPGNTIQAGFVCTVPRAALQAPGRASLYGHGLLGDPKEIDAGNVQDMAAEHDFVFCATPEIGMASEDVPNAIKLLGELSGFPSLADRLQQGLLDELYLGRLMIHPAGLVSNAAFQADGGRPVIDTSQLFYDSNSQGAILGGALTAVAPDFTRAVLGVGGMDFSLLLPRSKDFDAYSAVLYPAYPQEADRPLALSLIQMLWDRGETDGYAHHMTTHPLPNTPAHTVLLNAAVGDQQVSNLTAEVEARTMGASLYEPAFDAGRTPEATPLTGLPAIASFPFHGSALEFWDSGPPVGDRGNGPMPLTNTPPRAGHDPHESPRATPAYRRQKAEFLKVDGALVDVCAGKPCHAADFTGSP